MCEVRRKTKILENLAAVSGLGPILKIRVISGDWGADIFQKRRIDFFDLFLKNPFT